MPLMTSQSSPWDTYPFRQNMAASMTPASVQTPPPKLNGGPAALRDISLSANGRPASMNSNGAMLSARGSIPSIVPLGTISGRASIGSVGSLSSSESAPPSAATVDTPVNNMWHSDEPPKSFGLAAGSQMAPGPLANANMANATLLTVSGLSPEITARECHFIFALASDLLSVEISKNAVSHEIAVNAKFASVHSAQQAAHMLERRMDLLGAEIKTQLQAYAPSYVSHPNAPRSLYASRPLYGDSYWSQQPSTPISPSAATDALSNSRRQSLISPTDVYPTNQLGSLGFGSSAGAPNYPDQMHAPFSSGSSPTSMNHVATNANQVGPANPVVVNGSTSQGAPKSSAVSPMSTPTTQASGLTAIGTGLPGTPTAIRSVPHSSSSSSVQLSPTHSNHSQSHSQPPLQLNNPHHHPHHNQHSDSQKLPPPNPADQNPPCNTLYVGNLPPDTSEVELKDIFSQQAGYRRLCFRTKQNGPMCFVEFEDEVLAGKALSSLYGYALSNSVKGGIRLSYSKNPLGVRSRPLRK